MFQFPRCPPCMTQGDDPSRSPGCPIRRSLDHRVPAPPQSISPRGCVLPRLQAPRHPPSAHFCTCAPARRRCSPPSPTRATSPGCRLAPAPRSDGPLVRARTRLFVSSRQFSLCCSSVARPLGPRAVYAFPGAPPHGAAPGGRPHSIHPLCLRGEPRRLHACPPTVVRCACSLEPTLFPPACPPNGAASGSMRLVSCHGARSAPNAQRCLTA